MKRILCLLLGVILTFGLVGCGEKPVEEYSTESMQEYANNIKNQKEDRAQIEQKQYDSNKKSISEELAVTETKLKLKEYAIVDSILLEGKKSIVITFDYTNNEETNQSFGAIFSQAGADSRLTLYQDGIELRPDGVLAMKKIMILISNKEQQ